MKVIDQWELRVSSRDHNNTKEAKQKKAQLLAMAFCGLRFLWRSLFGLVVGAKSGGVVM